jgi:hypothetical protein
MRVPVIVEELAGIARVAEPVAFGLPLEKGAAREADELRLVTTAGEPVAAQVTPRARWSDGSLRWVFVDALLSVEPGGRRELVLVDAPAGASPPPAGPLEVAGSPEEVVVDTGALVASVPRRGALLIAGLRARGAAVLAGGAGLELTLEDDRRTRHVVELSAVDVSARGPVRCTLTLRGRLGPHLDAAARLSFWAGRGLVRIDLTLRNPRAARHAGGTWDLGDPGSVLFREIGLGARIAQAGGPAAVTWTDRSTGPLEPVAGTWLEVFQGSSGGERWRSRVHLNRFGRVPLTLRGYRVEGPRPGRRGDRASPSLWVTTPAASLGVTVAEFWQNFPKALEARAGALLVGLWPRRHEDLHELQGGEQKTHTVWLSAEAPGNLGWVQTPLVARSTPAHYVASGVFPQLLEWADDASAGLLDLTRAALDEGLGFPAKRERIDEHGWRSFGELYADHEDVGNRGPRPRVSHYNNQYDGVYAALAQFARSADPRWLRLADELARHVADIDVYHTRLDRSAYNGGLFWHTDHYTDAVTATHRCYTRHAPQAKAGPYGGGPGSEHNYVTGLVTHFYMTGWPPSAEAARSLASWVIDMDEREDALPGRLLPGSSGLATRTSDHSYHGPGRGSGNSLEALLDGLAVTGDERYLRKAEALIRRVIHPDDDRDAFELATDPEYRWSYVVFLLALVRYLEVKAERGELDARYGYGQAALISYARWMLAEERLSSEKRDRLEIWNESWPAQDLRKGQVLMHAGRHTADAEERRRLHERGRELFAAAQEELLGWDTRTLTRPLVLVMRYGYTGSWLAQHPDAPTMPIVPAGDVGRPSGFVSWKGTPKAYARRIRRLLRRR